MAKYIDAEKLIAAMADGDLLDKRDVAEWANHNAEDVAPVAHGEWLNFYGNFETAECSICSEQFDITYGEESSSELFAEFKKAYRYCPSCGAKMDGETDDDE